MIIEIPYAEYITRNWCTILIDITNYMIDLIIMKNDRKESSQQVMVKLCYYCK